MAAKFARFESSWLQRVRNTEREGVESVDELKQRLRTERAKLDHVVTAAAIALSIGPAQWYSWVLYIFSCSIPHMLQSNGISNMQVIKRFISIILSVAGNKRSPFSAQNYGRFNEQLNILLLCNNIPSILLHHHRSAHLAALEPSTLDNIDYAKSLIDCNDESDSVFVWK